MKKYKYKRIDVRYSSGRRDFMQNVRRLHSYSGAHWYGYGGLPARVINYRKACKLGRELKHAIW